MFRRMTTSVTGRRRRSQRRNFFFPSQSLPIIFCSFFYLNFRSVTIFPSPSSEAEKKVQQATYPLDGVNPQVKTVLRIERLNIADDAALGDEQGIKAAM